MIASLQLRLLLAPPRGGSDVDVEQVEHAAEHMVDHVVDAARPGVERSSLGPLLGGSLNGGVFGPNGSIFGENGIGALGYSQPGINITGHITANIYNKFGIARAQL